MANNIYATSQLRKLHYRQGSAGSVLFHCQCYEMKITLFFLLLLRANRARREFSNFATRTDLRRIFTMRVMKMVFLPTHSVKCAKTLCSLFRLSMSCMFVHCRFGPVWLERSGGKYVLDDTPTHNAGFTLQSTKGGKRSTSYISESSSRGKC